MRLARLAPKLPHGLDHVVHRDDMRLRQQPAVGVDRQRAAQADTPTFDELGCLTTVAEAELFELA